MNLSFHIVFNYMLTAEMIMIGSRVAIFWERATHLMWWYLYAHAAYHLNRWFPQGNRIKISAFLIIIALLLPVPYFYVVLLEKSARACDYPLLDVNVASLIFTFFTIGFTIIFCAMVPVPRPVKIAFHVFGLATFILAIIMIVYTWWSAEDCSYSVPELWILSAAGAWLAGLSIVFVVIMLPFWLINKAKTNLVMDPYSRTGICYEPAKCCTCLWHI